MMAVDTLRFSWNDLSLVGTLRLPDRVEPVPVVVMLQGSGPSDWTSNGYFPLIQEAFLSRGIGTYSFDKPGCGESTGDWRDYALEARADQVLPALDAVRSHPAVRADGVGIWGQSQGGWLVQMLAARLTDLRFAVANSGPSISVDQQDLYGCEHTMRFEGHGEEDIQRALAFISDLHAAAKSGLSYEEVDAQYLDAARSQDWYGYATIDDAEDWQSGSLFAQETFEPVEAMERIRVPYLAVYGGRDVLLPPWQSAEETGQALQRAGNADATVVVFPAGNHRIQDNATGDFGDGYLDLLADWMAHRVR